MKTFWPAGVVGLLALGWGGPGMAATVQTLGAASAVTTANRSATFDSLTANNVVHLDSYSENGLSITTSGDSWAADLNLAARLDPFRGANAPDRAFYAIAWANEDWVTIQTTNAAPVHGVEFMYGNDWTTGDISGPYPWGNDQGFVDWQTLQNGVVVSAGQIGPNPTLVPGTVLGFYDPAGFDQLQVRCRIANSSSPTLQALALDNLQVMLANVPPAPALFGSDASVDPATRVPTFTVFGTIPGCQYRLVYAETLVAPIWNPVATPPPDGWKDGGGTTTFSDPDAPAKPHRFYRVQMR
jgi:hypothetical protein